MAMAALVDTNVLLDYFMVRGAFFAPALEIIMRCAKDEFSGYVAFHTISNVWYILRQTPEEKRREMLREVCDVLEVIAVSHEAVVEAINRADFHDLEDCLQDQCAKSVGAQYIVTRDPTDFTKSEIPAILPEDFLKVLNRNAQNEGHCLS